MKNKNQNLQLNLILIFFALILSSFIAGGGFYYIKSQKEYVQKNTEDNLQSIAKLKVEQIVSWRKERLGDAVVISQGPMFLITLEKWLKEGKKEGNVKEILIDRLKVAMINYDYQAIIVLDDKGDLVLTTEDKDKICSYNFDFLKNTFKEKKTLLSDFYKCHDSDNIMIYSIAPLVFKQEKNEKILGELILVINPNNYIYPVIQSWPIVSSSSETLLVRREGNYVVYLNTLRHNKIKPVSLKFSLDNPNLPAAMAVKGIEGIVKGFDYRGVEVIASIKHIPDSNWHMVAKTDIDEIFSPFYHYLPLLLLAVISLLTLITSIIILFFILHRKSFYKKLYLLELERNNVQDSLDTIIQASPAAIIDLDISGNVKSIWNFAAEKMFGWKKEEVIGKMLPVENLKKSALSGDVLINMRLGCLKKDSNLIDISFCSAHVGETKNIIVIITDITESIKNENDKELLKEQLSHAQRMESVGRLAGGVAHDFNNALVPILGYGGMLLENLYKGDPRYEHVSYIIKSAERARDLTRHLMAFGRKQLLEIKTINLSEAINKFEKLLRRTIREDINIQIILSENPIFVKVDIGQIDQVIMNLVINAQDAMPNGGILEISLNTIEIDEYYAKHHLDVKIGSYAQITVSDNGTGIDKKIIGNIFEPFFTTKGLGEGTGLGLSIVYGIIKQHNGSIFVYSELGRGTTFKLYLPLSKDEEEIEPLEPISKDIPLGQGTILLVEDDAAVREVTVFILNRLGYNVIEAENPKSCIDLIEKDDDPSIDLMLTDVVLPDMNGRELYNKIVKKQPNLKVLYMSGYTDNIIAQQGILEKNVNFIQKPFTINSLSEKIRDVLSKVKND